jgi:hypothetical protein
MGSGGSQLYLRTVLGAGTGRPGLQLVPSVQLRLQAAACFAAYRASERVALGRWWSQPSPTSAWVELHFLPYSRLLWPRLAVSTPMEALLHRLRLALQRLETQLHRHRLALPNQRFNHLSPHPARNPRRFPNHHQSKAHVARLRIRGAITSAAGNISTALRRHFAVTSTASPVSGRAPTVMSISALTERTAIRVAGREPARIMAVSTDLYTGPRP